MAMLSILAVDIPLTLLAASLAVAYLWLKRRNYGLPLPPGPKGWPLIGNVFDMPMSRGWEVYHKWCKELGTGLLYLNATGTKIIVLDTYEDCVALLEKRSAIYSGRMQMPMYQDLMGWDFSFVGADYGNVWRRSRRLAHNSFNSNAVKSFQPLQLKTARKILPQLGENTDIMPLLRHNAGGTILSVTYGLDVQPKNDPFIESAEKAIESLQNIPYPGAYLVDHFHFLKYIPAWLPGAKFKRDANEWRKLTLDMINKPFDALKAEMARGTATPSFAYNLLQKAGYKETKDLYTDTNMRNVSASLYQAGVETVRIFVDIFYGESALTGATRNQTQILLGLCVLTLLSHPDMMEKIQDEIDLVTNGSRLPEFSDEENVPYLKAFIKEALRFWSFVPLSVPHYLSVDDEYKGYFLPADSMIIPNTWAIMHNEKVFVEPYTFNPDRFLTGDNLKEINAHYAASWGFGRRVCPGRFFAAGTMWITLAHILAVYDVKKAKDADGNVIEPNTNLATSVHQRLTLAHLYRVPKRPRH
ncbi:hypothetical protein D9619_001235 [Psilocybe cf. subviscida]|uniref:Cytochrome P450 n=1 Tax=Psilocybe cf. subviscida TaxID=2480587 RepID=A0A8H5BGA7_9AGAR|nr:hypothetical protein D9619_001235 [Psilocybe cf. subviscida]